MTRIEEERIDEMLAPCPFCGSTDIDAEGWGTTGGICGPACNNCQASVGSALHSTAENIETWNRRASPSGVEVKEDETGLQWRDLALQFDEHRIEAMSMLRYAIRHIEEYATVRDILREPLGELKSFLRKPPLSGSVVLEQQLKALSPSLNGVTVTDEMVERAWKAQREYHQSREISYGHDGVRAGLIAALSEESKP